MEYLTSKLTMLVLIFLTICLIVAGTDATGVESSSRSAAFMDYKAELRTISIILDELRASTLDPSFALKFLKEARKLVGFHGDNLLEDGITAETVDAEIHHLFDNDDSLEYLSTEIKRNNLDYLKRILDSLIKASESCDQESLDFLALVKSQAIVLAIKNNDNNRPKGSFLFRYMERLNCVDSESVHRKDDVLGATKGEPTSSGDGDVDMSVELHTVSMYLDEMKPKSMDRSRVIEHLGIAQTLLDSYGESLMRGPDGRKRKNDDYDLKYLFATNPSALVLSTNLKGNNLDYLKRILDGLIKASMLCDRESLNFLAMVKSQTSPGQFLNTYSDLLAKTCQGEASIVTRKVEEKLGEVSEELYQVMADFAHLHLDMQRTMAAGRGHDASLSNPQSNDPNEVLENFKHFKLDKQIGEKFGNYILKYYKDKLHLSDDGKRERAEFLYNFMANSLQGPCGELVHRWTNALRNSGSVKLSQQIVFEAMKERRKENINLDRTLEVVRICQMMLRDFSMAYTVVTRLTSS